MDFEFDLDTNEGMMKACSWLAEFLGEAKEGMLWVVPRSETVYEISVRDKVIRRVKGGGDEPTEYLAYLIGYRLDTWQEKN